MPRENICGKCSNIVCMSVVTVSECRHCGNQVVTGHAPSYVYCDKCAKELNACKQCGEAFTSLKFNGERFTNADSYFKAIHKHCGVKKQCVYYYGEANTCMFGENPDTDDKALCKCNIETIFRGE